MRQGREEGDGTCVGGYHQKQGRAAVIQRNLAMTGGLRCSKSAKRHRGEEGKSAALSDMDGRVRQGEAVVEPPVASVGQSDRRER
jgi:hypothetical protein